MESPLSWGISPMEDYQTALLAGSDSSWNSQKEAGPRESYLRHSKLSLLKGGRQAKVHSDQVVLVMAWREAGPPKRLPKALGAKAPSRKTGIVTS